jgi:hypothetical protein
LKPNESFTTSLFALYLLNPKGCKKFPLREVRPKYSCEEVDELDLGGLTFRKVGSKSRQRGVDIVVTVDRLKAHIENKLWARKSGGQQLSNTHWMPKTWGQGFVS